MDLLRQVRRGRLTRVIVPLLAAAAIPAVAGAEVITNTVVPFTVPATPNPCVGGAVIVWEGQSHLLVTTTESEGGGFYVQTAFNTRGVTGVDVVANKEYRLSEGNTTYLHIGPDGLPFSTKRTYRLVIQGPTRLDDFYVHITEKLTVNENGITTATVDNVSMECK